MINLATEFQNFLKFEQLVFEFDSLALRKSISFSPTAFYFICYPWQIVSRFSRSVGDNHSKDYLECI